MKILFISCLILGSLTASSQTGNVGIGTTIPLKPLHIVKGTGSGGVSTTLTSVFVDANTSHYISLMAPSGEETGILHGRPGGSIRSGIVFDLNSGIRFRSGGNVTRMLLDSIGNLGVGILSPQSRLHVANGVLVNAQYLPNATGIFESNNSSITGNLLLINPSTRDYSIVSATEASSSRSSITFAADSSLRVETGGNIEGLKINKTGMVLMPEKLGIGTTADPQQKLEVNGKIKIGNDNSSDVAGTIRYNTTTKDFEGFTGTGWVSLTKAGVHNLGSGSAGPIDNYRSAFPNDITDGKEFGNAVAIDSIYAVVGARRDGTPRGAAYILKKQANGSWLQEAKLLPDASDAIGTFGWSVAISGDYVAISDIVGDQPQGPPFDTSQVYIFKRTGTTWNKESRLSETAAEVNSGFGSEFGGSVAISGGYLLIGAKKNNGNTGSAIVYKRTGTTWARDTSLFHNITNIPSTSFFGTSVSINGDYLAVGSPGEHDNSGPPLFTQLNQSGRVYIYKLTGTQWVFQKKLLPGTYGGNISQPVITGFGSNVSLYGDKIIVGANLDRALFFYERTGADWLDEKRLSFNDIKTVSMYGNMAVITGSAMTGEPAKNFVFKYANKQLSWNLLAYYLDPDFAVPFASAIYKNEIIMGIPTFIKTSGVNSFVVGKVTFADVQ